MIDMHSHILPFIDDGSKSIEESLQMAKICESKGITDIICTPHYRDPYLANSQQVIQAVNELQEVLTQNQINIKLYPGQEIRYFKEMRDYLKNGEILTMNGTRCVLTEFDFDKETDISEVAYSLIVRDYIPIIAHVERYSYVDNIDTIYDIKNVGALIQINYDVLLGKLGKNRKKFAFNLLKEGLIDFISTDYHFYRNNEVEQAYELVCKKFSQEIADDLFTNHAKHMFLSGKFNK